MPKPTFYCPPLTCFYYRTFAGGGQLITIPPRATYRVKLQLSRRIWTPNCSLYSVSNLPQAYVYRVDNGSLPVTRW